MQNLLIWLIALVSIFLIIIRPFKIAEFYWALAGGCMLLLLRLITPAEAISGIGKGLDVYLFLTGMMLLAEIAKEEKLFDWLAALAVTSSKSSSLKLFGLIYLVGILTTVFLSNDATAVVLTPAVFAAVKAAKVKNPIPYLLICAFVANAASFVLPISNPANIVIYGKKLPPLVLWLRLYLIPSVVSVIVTYVCLYYNQRKQLKEKIESHIIIPRLSAEAKLAGWGILLSAIILLSCSALGLELGMPTFITGIGILLLITMRKGLNQAKMLSRISWGVIPMVAGLFVIVEGLVKTGLLNATQHWLEQGVQSSVAETTWLSGVGIALISNIMNNLPSGLIAANAVQISGIPDIVQRSILVGVDLGPNLSVTGSLATILWLVVLRKEGLEISAWQFLKIGFIVMLPALLLAIASLWI